MALLLHVWEVSASSSRHRLPSFRGFVIFFSPSIQILEKYIKICHGRFLFSRLVYIFKNAMANDVSYKLRLLPVQHFLFFIFSPTWRLGVVKCIKVPKELLRDSNPCRFPGVSIIRGTNTRLRPTPLLLCANFQTSFPTGTLNAA